MKQVLAEKLSQAKEKEGGKSGNLTFSAMMKHVCSILKWLRTGSFGHCGIGVSLSSGSKPLANGVAYFGMDSKMLVIVSLCRHVSSSVVWSLPYIFMDVQ